MSYHIQYCSVCHHTASFLPFVSRLIQFLVRDEAHAQAINNATLLSTLLSATIALINFCIKADEQSIKAKMITVPPTITTSTTTTASCMFHSAELLYVIMHNNIMVTIDVIVTFDVSFRLQVDVHYISHCLLSTIPTHSPNEKSNMWNFYESKWQIMNFQ